MDLDEIRKHWDHLAKEHGCELESTTKTPTIKQLEINALSRVINQFLVVTRRHSILEVGCGNGHNMFGLARLFPHFTFLGLDYSEEMILAARKLNENFPDTHLEFAVGDVLRLSETMESSEHFDLVFTDRLLINLNSWELQQSALTQLALHTGAGGFLVLIENFSRSYSNQNRMRQALGLAPREPDRYNKFIDEEKLEDFVTRELKFETLYSESFGSLHDLLLYVLIPDISEGKIVYDHPLMESVTRLLTMMPDSFRENFGSFGQNQLYVFQRQ